MNLELASTIWCTVDCKDENGKCTCGCEVGIGDQVVCPGLQGRGMVTARNGRRLTVKYRSGLVITRDRRDVQKI